MPPSKPTAPPMKAAASMKGAAASVGTWVPTGNDTLRLQQKLQQAVIVLAAAAAQVSTLANLFRSMAPANDFTQLEAVLNLQPGQGQTLRDTMVSCQGDLTNGPAGQILANYG